MPRTSNRRWKGCMLCKPWKHAGNGDTYRIPRAALKNSYDGRKRRVNRHDVGSEVDR